MEKQSLFYTVRVAVRQEKIVAMMLEQKAKVQNLPVYSIIFNDKIAGYIIVEVDNENTALKLINGVKHVKGLINKPIDFDEVKRIVTFVKEEKISIEVGDIVEITEGPFKGERAKVTAVDKLKDTYTVLPIEVAIAIPVNIKGKNIKFIKKGDE